jgi:hypothetical protein
MAVAVTLIVTAIYATEITNVFSRCIKGRPKKGAPKTSPTQSIYSAASNQNSKESEPIVSDNTPYRRPMFKQFHFLSNRSVKEVIGSNMSPPV